MRAWWRLFIARARMVYRSRDTVLTGLAQPVILIGLLALYKQLRFETSVGTIDFFSFVATGWAAYGVVGVAQHSMVGAAADYRVLGVLKRVAVTPISPAAFVSAQVVARVGAAVLQIAATLGIAAVLGAHVVVSPNLAWVLPLAAITALIGMSLAFVAAGVTGTPDAANNLDLTLALPVYFLAGVIWPIQSFPGILRHLVDYAIPFTGLLEALRGVALGGALRDIVLAGAGIADVGRNVLIALGWMLVALAVATRAYRMTAE